VLIAGKMQDTMTEILPGLYVGDMNALRSPVLMCKIDAVVSALRPTSRQYIETSPEVLRANRDWLFVGVYDLSSAPIEAYFKPVYRFIRKHRLAGDSVLVHCAAGISRSITLVIYYLLRRKLAPNAASALAMIREKRPDAQPNPGFMLKLESLKF
jgi:dual specificity phosphatase 12